MSCCVHASPFPADASSRCMRLFFEKLAAVRNLFMRRDAHTLKFRGSIVVEFQTKAEADKVRYPSTRASS